MATKKTELDSLMENVQELENFLHALIPTLDEKKLSQGDSVLPYIKASKLKIPQSLRGLDITWEAEHSHSPAKRGGESLSLVRQGHPDIVGLVIKCVKIKGWKFCLECGWFWCRIVVTKRF